MCVDVLQRFGMSLYEAKILATLLSESRKEQWFSAADISRLAGVPITKIYQVLSVLRSKRLVSVTSGSPTKYTSQSIEIIRDSLIGEYKEALRQARKWAHDIKVSRMSRACGVQLLEKPESVLLK
ncbi:hypothetical protein HY546_01965 [archaeon]|nr:hypothetical protein [archaeon]